MTYYFLPFKSAHCWTDSGDGTCPNGTGVCSSQWKALLCIRPTANSACGWLPPALWFTFKGLQQYCIVFSWFLPDGCKTSWYRLMVACLLLLLLLFFCGFSLYFKLCHFSGWIPLHSTLSNPVQKRGAAQSLWAGFPTASLSTHRHLKRSGLALCQQDPFHPPANHSLSPLTLQAPTPNFSLCCPTSPRVLTPSHTGMELKSLPRSRHPNPSHSVQLKCAP